MFLNKTMMKELRYYLVVIYFMLSAASFAQSSISPSFLNDSNNNYLSYITEQINDAAAMNNLNLFPCNRVDVVQFGNNNEAYIEQIKSNDLSGNVSAVIQYVDNNSASINQIGNGNKSLVTQNGMDNKLDIDVSGNFNNSVMFQEGSNNILSQKLNSDNKTNFISQQGTNNIIMQQENELTSKPLLIHQKGSGMRLIITNSAIK